MPPKSFFRFTIILISILIIAGTGYAGWTIWNRYEQIDGRIKQNSIKENAALSVRTNDSRINMSDWKTYRNEEYGFDLKYPMNWFLSIKKTPGEYGIFIRQTDDENKREGFFIIPAGLGWGDIPDEIYQVVIDNEPATRRDQFYKDTKNIRWSVIIFNKIKLSKEGHFRLELHPSENVDMITLEKILRSFKFL